jgi:hypothetical protein
LFLLCFSAAASCIRLSSSAAAELPDPEEIADVVIEFDANEAPDVPSKLVADTVKLYAVEVVSPAIVIVPAVSA